MVVVAVGHMSSSYISYQIVSHLGRLCCVTFINRNGSNIYDFISISSKGFLTIFHLLMPISPIFVRFSLLFSKRIRFVVAVEVVV